MRRWNKGEADSDLVGLISFIIVVFLIVRGCPDDDGSSEREPISYAMKNTVTYTVKAECPNCKKIHKIESTVGNDVKIGHSCPWCGVKREYSILSDK